MPRKKKVYRKKVYRESWVQKRARENRAKAYDMLRAGHSYARVASVLGVVESTVRRWEKRVRAELLAAEMEGDTQDEVL